MARAAAAAPARAPRQRPAPRRATPPRRRSGPVRKAPLARSLRSRAAGVADALLHGRGWIALVAVLLVGIVFFNVDLLQMNRDIAQTASKAAAVKRENAALKLRVAKLSSTERIQRAAEQEGLVLPPPGQIRYLRARRGPDGRRAARQLAAWTQGGAPAVAAPTPAAQQTATAQPVAAQPQPQPATQQQPPPAAQQPQAAQPQPQAQSQAAPTTSSPTGATATP